MPESRPTAPLPSPGRTLAARVGLARAAVFWERGWPEFAPAFGVLGLFLAAALFDLPAMVPGWVHAAVLVVLVLLLAWAIGQGVRALRIPGESEGRRRIEAASGLEHRPLATLATGLPAAPAIRSRWRSGRRTASAWRAGSGISGSAGRWR